jgi:SAM-dependent methyltransferase
VTSLAPWALVTGVVALSGVAWLVAIARSFGRAPSSPLEHAVERTARRFERAAEKKGDYYFARGKLQGDPATAAIAGLGALGSVLDLGCGRGQLALLLLEAEVAERVHGVDWDGAKVAFASRAAEGLRATFETGDVREAAGGPFDTVLLVDVLHYFSREVQDALLDRAASLVKPGGRIVVREADRGRGLRSLTTRIQEGVGTWARVNVGERVLFRDVERELVPRLERLGFDASVVPCWGSTPFSNVLLVATRRAP